MESAATAVIDPTEGEVQTAEPPIAESAHLLGQDGGGTPAADAVVDKVKKTGDGADLDSDVLDVLRDDEDELPAVVLGRELAKTLHVYVGDQITLVSPVGDLGPMGVLPRARKFRVAAVFYSGMYEYDSSHAYLTLPVAQDFLAHFGLTEPAASPAARQAQRRYQLLETRVVRTPEFRFVRPVVGFEVFAKGELIATDGDEEIRALCEDCTILMPTRQPIVGREGVYLAKPI